MSLKPFFHLWRDGRLSALVGAAGELKSFYKLSFLAAAGESGLLNRLASGTAMLDSLAEFYVANSRGREALEAWLQMGIHLRLLSLGPRGYELRGLAKKLARPENDSVLAMVEEVVELHHKLITGTISKLRIGELWSLDDQDGVLIARSSRILEAFQSDDQRHFPREWCPSAAGDRLWIGNLPATRSRKKSFPHGSWAGASAGGRRNGADEPSWLGTREPDED